MKMSFERFLLQNMASYIKQSIKDKIQNKVKTISGTRQIKILA